MRTLFLIFVLALLNACSHYEEIYYIPADSFRTERLRLREEAQRSAEHVIEVSRRYVDDARIKAACAAESSQKVEEFSATATYGTPARIPTTEATTADRPPRTTTSSTININTASARQLERLPRVGPSTAQAIISARPFGTTEDILRVRGIGPATFQQIKDRIRVDD